MFEQRDISKLSGAEKDSLIGEFLQKLKAMEQDRSRLEQQVAIHQLWSKLQGKLFPDDCRGKVINDISLDLLEADFFGCITTFMNDGKISDDQLQYLLIALKRLDSVKSDLSGYGGYYFKRLGLIASQIVEFKLRYSI